MIIVDNLLLTKQWKKIEKYAYFGIAVSLVILVAISSTSSQSLVRIQKDFNWATNTREVLVNLSYFLSSLKDAEMGQRGFMLTGQESYLDPYKYVEKGVKSHFTTLRGIAADNITQQTRIDTCERLVTEKMQDLQEMITLQKNKGAEAVKKVILTGTGKQIMDEIQTLVLKMDEEERTLLDQRSKGIALRVKLDAVVKTIGFILLLITAFLIISRENYWFAEYRNSAKEQMDLINMKSDFVATVSHELRTPLKAIRESIAIVLDGLAGQVNEEQKKFLAVSERNVDRLARLIDNVLDCQKLNSGKTVLDLCDNDINETAQEVYGLMTRLAEKKGLNISMKLDGQLPKIKFDRDKIIQVLTNLVHNAIKFTEKGAIAIATGMDNNVLCVSVKDTGRGITREDMHRIFNRFEQISCNNHKKTGGVGLGLSISKDIIQLHNGRIWAESEPGKGTTVSFMLPITVLEKI
ncbi:MAG: CHASE3 domain-containing protein [Anaerohalosphaera sp.]|nr:CHASE3 domain-containing protein [Anaerohalosphaera sp.]